MQVAGGLQLTISVLHGVQAHWASVFILPKQVLKDTDDTSRKFVWSDTELNKNRC